LSSQIGSRVEPILLVVHDSKAKDKEAALADTVAAITKQEGCSQVSPILAVIAGAFLV
jgi:hypothetical protein